jgi:phosphoribosylformimino-5-aminoimidazole carboxamide ribotide isomerase
MIVPCIDLQGGRAVQLVRGRRRMLEVEDVSGLLKSFRRYKLLHVIDLDAAMRRGRNDRLVRSLCWQATFQYQMKVRVGGGIRTVARAARIAGWGADKVIVGSAVFRDGRLDHKFLKRIAAKIGRKRVMLALDTSGGFIVVRGWREKLRLLAEDVIPELEEYCSEFLCTYVDAEGTMKGTNLKWFRALRRATNLPITAAGGIRSHREVRALERLKMNAAIGMAMYRGKIS